MELLSRNDEEPRVLTFGEPLIIFIPNATGGLEQVQGFSNTVGGAELNTAIGLSRLNIPVSYSCALATDPFSRRVLRSLRADNVDVQYAQVVDGGQTGVLFKQRQGLMEDPSVYYYRTSTPSALGLWNTEPVLNELVGGRWQWIHTTGITCMVSEYTRTSTLNLLEMSKRLRIPVSFDVNIRLKMAALQEWKRMVQDVLPNVSWLLLGDEEAELLFGTNEIEEVLNQIQGYGFEGLGLVVKRGHRGALCLTSGRLVDVPAWQVKHIVDTVGAGDGFNAGWIAGMVKGWTLEDAMALGSLVGAHAVTSPGDHDGYPDWQMAMDYLRKKGTVLR